MSQKNGLIIGLIIAICGTFVLGTDSFTASADSNSILGRSITNYTVIGLALLIIAVLWFWLFKGTKKENK